LWALFGVPLLSMLIAWIGIVSNWRTVSGRAVRLLVSIAMIFPTAAGLLACGGLAYVEGGAKVHDAIGFYGDIFFLSLAGFLLGAAVTIALNASLVLSYCAHCFNLDAGGWPTHPSS
jgi:hypothetical protein